MVDFVNLRDDIDYFNRTSLKEIKEIINAIAAEIRAMAEEFDGIQVTIKPLKKESKNETITNRTSPSVHFGGSSSSSRNGL